MTLREIEKGIIVDIAKIEKFKELDSIVFDCDGVLIDVSNSYDLTIKKVVDFVVKEIDSLNESDLVTTKMIEGFKNTGGFNDEVDVTYALILSIITAKKMSRHYSELIFNVIENSDETGIKSVEKYLEFIKADITKIKESLDYPGKKFDNSLSSIFDEMFYGSDLYTKLYNRKPKFNHGKGLIENDVVLLSKDLLKELHNRFDRRIAIVSGRSQLSAKYSLKELFNEFNLDNSRFLEDEPREMAKPNPQSLLSTIKGLKGNCSMFVGDSIEDYIMARKVYESGYRTVFCGVYGTSENPEKKRALFEKKNIDVIVKSIDQIPKTLNLVGA